MANTGLYAYGLLEQYNVLTGLPSGNTKPNLPGEADYVVPRNEENGLCPLVPIPVIRVSADVQGAGGDVLANFIIASDAPLPAELLVNVDYNTRDNVQRTVRLLPAPSGRWESGGISLTRQVEAYDFGYVLVAGDGYRIDGAEYAFLLNIPALPTGGGDGGGDGGFDPDGPPKDGEGDGRDPEIPL